MIRVLAALTACLALFASPAHAADDIWKRADTRHFTIYSTGDGDDLTAFARDLERFDGLLRFWYDKPDLHWERSPLKCLDQAKTPTMIVHGLRDDRVHPAQSMELYRAFHDRNVPTSLIMYPREPHGITERAHQLDYMQRLIDWYNKYVKKDDDLAS